MPTPPRSSLRAVGERDSGASRQRQQADRQVDEENRPPAEVEDVGLYQHAAEDDAGERGGALDDAVDGEGPAALLRRERHLDDRQYLRKEHRPGDPLQHARGDEQFRPRRQAAQDRRQGEPRHADHKHPFAADNIAEPAAGDEADGVGEAVGGDDQLHLGEAGVEVRLDVRQGDVDDEEVEGAEEGGGDDDGEGEPAAQAGRAGGVSPRMMRS